VADVRLNGDALQQRVHAVISRQNHGKVKRAKAIFQNVPQQIEVLNHRRKNLTAIDTKDTKTKFSRFT